MNVLLAGIFALNTINIEIENFFVLLKKNFPGKSNGNDSGFRFPMVVDIVKGKHRCDNWIYICSIMKQDAYLVMPK